MTKRGTPPKNVNKKGDTACFRRPRGFQRTCGRMHQSNGPAGCMRFHGTLFFTYSPSLYQNRTAKHPTACGTSTLLSKKSNVRTGNISDLRTASVCFIQEEPHNIPFVLNRGRIQLVIRACPVTTGCIVAMS